VPSSERAFALDVLRGWAVFGILVVNLSYFARQALPRAGFDDMGALLFQVLTNGKFWTLFSMLFGLGFALQVNRAAASGSRFAPVYVRRLLILLLFGVLHALLHPREILHQYALAGFLLLPLRRASTRTLVVVGLVGLLIPPAVQGLGARSAEPPELARERQAAKVEVYSEGSLLELMTYNARRFRRETITVQLLYPFPYFLLGFYAGRRRFHETFARHLPHIRRARWWTLGLGLGLQAAVMGTAFLPPSVLPPESQPLQVTVMNLGNAMLGLFYGCVILLLLERAEWTRRLGGLAAVGRLALTNYLLQTVVLTTLVYEYGAGLYGRLGFAPILPIALLIFLVQVVLSRWWLQRFRFGPMEWLWRSASYGRPQPLRA
jgi:uncharacterized protein